MKTAACMIVKNEAGTIAEWMAYHLAIGFDTLLIFDNASTDATPDVIRSFARRHDVRRINWAVTDMSYQQKAYYFAITHFGNQFDWMAFIDSDEFIVPLRHETIGSFLRGFPNAPAIAVSWAMFGSSGHVRQPDGLIIENFRRRSEPSFWPNRHVKSIVRPAVTGRALNPHFFDVAGDYVTPDGTPVNWSDEPGIAREAPVYDVIQVNHYFVKSKEQWARKMARGYHDVTRGDHEGEFNYNDRNDIEDNAILRFVARTRAIIAAAMD